MLFPKSKKEWEASRARERKGKEEGREGGSLWWQVLSAQTLNKRGLSWACAMELRAQGTCVTHIPETPAFPFHKGGRQGQLHTTPTTWSSNNSLGSPCPLYHSHRPKVKSLELGLLRFPTHSYQTEATRQRLNTHL